MGSLTLVIIDEAQNNQERKYFQNPIYISLFSVLIIVFEQYFFETFDPIVLLNTRLS